MTEVTLATEGQRPHRVRVYICTTPTGARIVRVEWRERGRRVREAKPDSKAVRTWARARAKEVAARLLLGQQRSAKAGSKTTRDAVDAYLLANKATWRPTTYRGAERKLEVWCAYVGDGMPIGSTTPELVDAFRETLRTIPRDKTGLPMAAHQISRHANEVKALLRFAKARKFVTENPLADYVIRLGKDERPLDVPEYQNDEWAAVLAELSPRQALQWRPYALIVLGGILGARQTALRSLRWSDVDLGARTVTWPAEFDKVGRERVQPLPRAAARAFRIAMVWRRRSQYDGPWVFFGTQGRTRGKPYTYQALNYQLHEAERRAGVVSHKYRAMHGLRRTAAGNALATTNNVKTAGQWIGDTDPKSLNRYLKQRDEHLRDLASRTHTPATPTATEKPTAPKGRNSKGGKSK